MALGKYRGANANRSGFHEKYNFDHKSNLSYFAVAPLTEALGENVVPSASFQFGHPRDKRGML